MLSKRKSIFKYTNTENCKTERVKIEGEKKKEGETVRMRESESGKSSVKLLWEQVKHVYMQQCAIISL